MENRKLFSISFFINFIFSMLTSLLSLIVFNINHSKEDISVIMITFMCSLLITRILSLSNFLKSRIAIMLGSVLFVIVCAIFIFKSENMAWMFVGAALFGMSIGLVPPAILVLLSQSEEKRDSNLAIYNAIVAIASVFAPIIGETIFDFNSQVLFMLWLILALVMAIVSFLLKRESPDEKKLLSNKTFYNLKLVMSDKLFQISFSVLLFTSISYGAIVSYLPIYFDSTGLSIGIYYLFFLSGYILAQFLKRIRYNFKIILLALSFVLAGHLSLVFLYPSVLLYIFTFTHGLGYGGLYKVFYIGIGSLKSEEERNIGFSIIGLISYIGVGLAPIFLMPFNRDWTSIFMGTVLYIFIAIILLFFLWKRNYNQNN